MKRQIYLVVKGSYLIISIKGSQVFFKEIQKKMSVKILKDFEKELRTKIRDELDLEKKN